MKSANDIITRVSSLKPNTLSDYLGDYLMAVELRVQKDLLKIKSPVYNASNLSLEAPEDTIYELYLFAVIDFLNGEFGRYENTLSVFTSAWQALIDNYGKNPNADTENGNNGDNTSSDTDNTGYDRRFRLW